MCHARPGHSGCSSHTGPRSCSSPMNPWHTCGSAARSVASRPCTRTAIAAMRCSGAMCASSSSAASSPHATVVTSPASSGARRRTSMRSSSASHSALACATSCQNCSRCVSPSLVVCPRRGGAGRICGGIGADTMRGARPNTSSARGSGSAPCMRSTSSGVLRRRHSSSTARGTAPGAARRTAVQLRRGGGARPSSLQSGHRARPVRRLASTRAHAPACDVGAARALVPPVECRRRWVRRASGLGESTGDGSGDVGRVLRLGGRDDTCSSPALAMLDGTGWRRIVSGWSSGIASGERRRGWVSNEPWRVVACASGDDARVDQDPERNGRCTGLEESASSMLHRRLPVSSSRGRGDMLTSAPIAATSPGSTPSGPPTGELLSGSTIPVDSARRCSGGCAALSRVGLEPRSGTAGGPMLPGGVPRRTRAMRGTLAESEPLCDAGRSMCVRRRWRSKAGCMCGACASGLENDGEFVCRAARERRAVSRMCRASALAPDRGSASSASESDTPGVSDSSSKMPPVGAGSSGVSVASDMSLVDDGDRATRSAWRGVRIGCARRAWAESLGCGRIYVRACT